MPKEKYYRVEFVRQVKERCWGTITVEPGETPEQALDRHLEVGEDFLRTEVIDEDLGTPKFEKVRED